MALIQVSEILYFSQMYLYVTYQTDILFAFPYDTYYLSIYLPIIICLSIDLSLI